MTKHGFIQARLLPSQAMRKTARRMAGQVKHALLIVILALQLLAAVQHHHELSNSPNDCVACTLAGHFSTGMAAAVVVILYAALSARWVPPLRRYCFSAPASRHRLPLAQAPPSPR